ncbi:MAG: methyltransferase domain-containing protein [Firmicutes bacterium]|nr:methyltransferase domain-containing protein [Bacillota bacterium]
MSRHGYSRDMHEVDWAEVFAQQQKRRPAIEAWLDALELAPGARMADFGCGPGLAVLLAARRVGPQGWVCGIDRSAGALAFLQQQYRQLAGQDPAGLGRVFTVQADAASAQLPGSVDAALVTNMLHHADDPQGVLANVSRWLVPGGTVVVAEFDPAAAGEFGPPLEERLAPDVLQRWAEAAGLQRVRSLPGGSEQYAFLLRKPHGRGNADSRPAGTGRSPGASP